MPAVLKHCEANKRDSLVTYTEMKGIIDAYFGDEPLYLIDEGKEADDLSHPMNTQRMKDHGVLVRVWPIKVDDYEG